MNPGLPGTGIGGLFYIVVALAMPLCELWRRVQSGAPARAAFVAKQFAIALGVVASMTGTFWGLDSVLMLNAVAVHVASIGATSWSIPLRVSALVTTSCVLLGVLGSVQVARLCLRLGRSRRAAG